MTEPSSAPDPAARNAAPEHLRSRPNPGSAADTGRIPELDGLRGVAIALVVVYHIWFNRVSGGVDVFFLLSGFLITLSLVRSVERSGRIDVVAFYSRIVRRLFPAALGVLLGVLVAAVIWLPRVRWQETLHEIVAAAFYLANWHLAAGAVDYLDAQNAAGPAQHYWSLAVQGQFYLVWPLVIAAAALLARRMRREPRRVAALLLTAVAGLSLSYSVAATAVEQSQAYFSTVTRLWEFAVGGLLGLALPRLRPPRLLAMALSWIGLLALVACGMVFSGAEFPGYAALWPVLAGALMIATAGGTGRFGADRLLRSTALRGLGRLSYSLYLWHWPVLVCYLAETERSVPGLSGGLMIIAVALALSAATHRLLEERLPNSAAVRRGRWGGYALGAGCLALLLLGSGAWAGAMALERRQEAHAVAQAGPEGYPGALVLADEDRVPGPLPELPPRPGALEAKDDLPDTYTSGCHQNQQESAALSCSFGSDAEDAQATVALVGGSHAAHWLPALQEVAERYRWRIVSMTKSACLFSTEKQYLGEESYTACHEWNENVLAELEELRPDAVFTTATRVGGGREETPEGYVEQWRALEERGLEVVAVRDTPWPMIDVPECVESHGPHDRRCGRDRTEMYPTGPPEVSGRDDLPGNVRFLDFTDALCTAEHCPAVVGNVLVYRDGSHLTATYARTLAPVLEEELAPLPEP